MNDGMLRQLEERFLLYARIDTQSDETSSSAPSTAKQLDLQRLLVKELEALNVQDVELTDYGCVLATLPATSENADVPTVAFLAHVDTVPGFSGANVKPIVHRDYSGDPIVLPDDPTQVLSPDEISDLTKKVGEDIVTASGTTLLGADNKAGVAIIMTTVDHLLAHPEIPHGTIRIAFTADEEIGRGVAHLTPDALAADVAYTLDGGPLGEITYESFSADKAIVRIQGVSIHPGTAKGKMVNALQLAATFATTLPQSTRTPETTDGREGFIHLCQMHGTAAQAQLHYILRDFELEGLQAHGELIRSVANTLQAGEPRARIECKITPQYRNMRYWLKENMHPVEMAITAIKDSGIEPVIKPIRGGTDGSRLTELGLPTPNLFAGTHAAHGPKEWVSLQDMGKAVEVCVHLVTLWNHSAKSDDSNGYTPQANEGHSSICG